MWSLIAALFDASEAAPLRRRVAELEATLKERDATIAGMTQRLDVAVDAATFYYDMAAKKPCRMIEDCWGENGN